MRTARAGERRVGRVAAVACGLIAALAMGCAEDPPATSDLIEAQPSGPSVTELLDRLAALEPMLPDELLPASFAFERPLSADTVGGAAVDLRRRMDAVEPELRGLYAEADDVDDPVADAVATIARGWLEVWQAAALLAEAEGHDLAFPLASRTADGVSTAADDLRLQIESGVRLILTGAARHRDGYRELRGIDVAEPSAQATFNRRADRSEDFDAALRPRLHELVSRRTTSVIAVPERFSTSAPGVEPRAEALEIACLDREELAERGGFAIPTVIEETLLHTPDRLDCPNLAEVPFGSD